MSGKRIRPLGTTREVRVSMNAEGTPTAVVVGRCTRRVSTVRERWRIERTRFDLDDEGYGAALYVVTTPERCYSLVCFSHFLEPENRTDRVIAEAWGATFSLFDGVPTDADIDRLAEQTPKQEAGRFQASELVM